MDGKHSSVKNWWASEPSHLVGGTFGMRYHHPFVGRWNEWRNSARRYRANDLLSRDEDMAKRQTIQRRDESIYEEHSIQIVWHFTRSLERNSDLRILMEPPWSVVSFSRKAKSALSITFISTLILSQLLVAVCQSVLCTGYYRILQGMHGFVPVVSHVWRIQNVTDCE